MDDVVFRAPGREASVAERLDHLSRLWDEQIICDWEEYQISRAQIIADGEPAQRSDRATWLQRLLRLALTSASVALVIQPAAYVALRHQNRPQIRRAYYSVPPRLSSNRRASRNGSWQVGRGPGKNYVTVGPSGSLGLRKAARDTTRFS